MVGHFKEPAPENETEKQLLDLMINYKMYIGSDEITMMGLQKGFSLVFTLFLIWPGVLGLYVSKRVSTQLLRNINFIYVGVLLAELAISLVYFFIIPTACVAIATLFFGIAIFRIK
jgi:hypothetical protein